MKLSVGVKVAHTLAITPQLQQSIRILQLSSLELEQEIQQQLESNPLLELVDDYKVEQSSPESSEINNDDYDKNEIIPEDLPVDTDWDDIFNHQSTALATPEAVEQGDYQSNDENLNEHLLWQINLLHLSAVEKVIAYCIVDALDDRGYLSCTLDEILTATSQLLSQMDLQYDVELDEVKVVLKMIQRLDPIGVASRDLVECLSIQLENYRNILTQQNNDYTALGLELIQFAQSLLQHADLLITNDVNRLMRFTQLDLQQLQQVIELLKSFDPAPGAKFQQQELEYQIPDVIVQKKNDRWQVILNPDILPKLRVNHYYAGMIKRADQSEENQYLKNQMQEAKHFIKSIDDRHTTLLKVATSIVKNQRDFFEIGAEAMKPLVLRDVAAELDLHESTISRVTTNKYMLTPRGLFELKYFFSSHVATAEGGECSATAIRARIKKLISQENPKKPLSDSAITKILQDDGIDVARRTVAKYRESLNIPSSSERKVLI